MYLSHGASTWKHFILSYHTYILPTSRVFISNRIHAWLLDQVFKHLWHLNRPLTLTCTYLRRHNEPKVSRNSPWPRLSPIPVSDPGHVHMPLDGLPPGVQHPDQSLVLALGSVAHQAGVGPLGLLEICRGVLICLYHCPSRFVIRMIIQLNS